MPDSLIPPGQPLLRDTSRRTSELGTGASRRTAPGETAASAAACVNGNGADAQGERPEPRWRDIQWVDFTSGPISDMYPVAAEPHAAPAHASVMSEPVLPLWVAPELPETLPLFATDAASIETLAGLRSTTTNGARVMARHVARERADDDRPFPASITVPVSAGSPTDEAETPGFCRFVVATVAAVAGDMLRAAADVVAAAAAAAIAAARAALGRCLPTRRAARDEPWRRDKPAVARRLSAVADRISGCLAARENRLRVSGLAALVVISVALAAYGGGALLARMVESASAPSPTNKVEAAAPAANLIPARAAALPSDPAIRAAFYIARAKTGNAAAQYDLGLLYAQGQGLVQDYASAASWFRAAAAQGNVAAEYNLGVLYDRGLGVTANPTEAINWYRSAADQNHPSAQFNLALAYANGNGTKQDFATAARWYRRAAEQGLAPAMVNLAILYEAGNGVDRSPIDAYAWYRVAGERGDDPAKVRATELYRQFDDTDKTHAERLVATIRRALDAVKPPPA
ncbi:MAG TPA: tetratricopeptide repeat protein [Stellaceae bacterium]|nr:tetratricopeptide repeat protein [Stellaceae bacterium]